MRKYSQAVKHPISAVTRMEEQRRGDGAGTAAADVQAALAAAEDEKTVKWESTLLLGRSDVIIAAHGYGIRVRSVLSGPRERHVSRDEAIEVTSQARRAYYQAAKADTGTGPEAYKWQLARCRRQRPPRRAACRANDRSSQRIAALDPRRKALRALNATRMNIDG